MLSESSKKLDPKEIEEGNEKKIPDAEKRRMIRDELIVWLQAEPSQKTPETVFNQEEAERWVDTIFSIEDDGSLTMHNALIALPLLGTRKLPPSLRKIKGDLNIMETNCTDLEALRGITIDGDLYLSRNSTSLPLGLSITGKIIGGDWVSKEGEKKLIAQYPNNTVDIRRQKG